MDILKTEYENILLKETTVHDLPPDQNIETTLIMRHVVKASRALSELDNKAARLPNQDILISNMVNTDGTYINKTFLGFFIVKE